MNKILQSRLKEIKLSSDMILNAIYKNNTTPIFIYDSHLENLGTKDSDLDIYVIVNNWDNIQYSREYENFKVKVTYINNVPIDVEYWKADYIENLINKINNNQKFQYNDDELKLLLRLNIGEIIWGADYGQSIKNKIKRSNIKNIVMNRYLIFANSSLEDCINLYKAKEFICSLICARNALENAVGAVNARYNNLNLNLKWIPKLFIDRSGYNTGFLERYLKYQVYTSIDEENIQTIIEEIIALVQDIVSYIVLESL